MTSKGWSKPVHKQFCLSFWCLQTCFRKLQIKNACLSPKGDCACALEGPQTRKPKDPFFRVLTQMGLLRPKKKKKNCHKTKQLALAHACTINKNFQSPWLISQGQWLGQASTQQNIVVTSSKTFQILLKTLTWRSVSGLGFHSRKHSNNI